MFRNQSHLHPCSLASWPESLRKMQLSFRFSYGACSRMLGVLRLQSCASSSWRTWWLSCTSCYKKPFPHRRRWTLRCLGHWQGPNRRVRLSISTAHRLLHEIKDLLRGKVSYKSCTRSDRHSGSSLSHGLVAHRGYSRWHGLALMALGPDMSDTPSLHSWGNVLDMRCNRVHRTTDLNIPSD